MPHIYDQNGNNLGILPGDQPRTGEWSFGASLWEFLNPGNVQQEDEVIGKPLRTYQEIFSDAFFGMASAAEEGRQEIVRESQNVLSGIGPIVVGAAVIAGAIIVLTRK